MYISLDGLVVTLIVSLLAGLIASVIMGESKNSLLTNLLLGFFGSWVAGILAGILGIHFWGFVSSLIIATLGAMLLIWLGRKFLRSNPNFRV